MEEIWRVCQKTVEIIIKFDKATGHGSDLTSNMDTLIKMVKEHLSVHILAIESKSSLTDYERKDFKSEYGDVMSTLMRTITSIIAKGSSNYNYFTSIMFIYLFCFYFSIAQKDISKVIRIQF